MRTLIAVLVGTAMLALGGQTIAQSTAKDKLVTTQERVGIFRSADVNKDGMLSREEFMKFHEAAWERTKRNASGMAMMADVEATYRPGTVPSAIPGQPRAPVKP